nr:EAL domain-containing protein [Quadrisphaera sp. RL12-1S]
MGRDVHAWTVQVARSAQAREQLQQQVSHQADHDGLTGLAVRARVLADLEAALVADRAAGRRTGLLFVDLDGFKAVNDTHGHAAGDELLRVVAARLREAVRAGDVVGRLGGDEFVVVVPDSPDAEALVRRAGRLVRAVSEPVALGGFGVVVGASVGVATTSAVVVPGEDGGGEALDAAGAARALLAEADTAAYRAKAAGRGRVELFDDRLRAQLTGAAQDEHALRTALALGQLRVVYQPVVPLGAQDDGDGRLLGVEALLRWDRPGHGPVDPAQFIAVAERSSLVRDLGCFVLAEAALQLVRWRVRGRDVPSVSVNVSGRHLADPRVVTDVLEALATSGLAPERLLLEITETVLVDDPRATANLRALRAHGVRVAIDDFGTGFTSISALATTPADQLKVGRGFVVAEAAADAALLELMARAGAAFGLEVVAEGVETAEQAARAVRAGCTGGQGWHFAPALAADELEHRLPLLRDSRVEVRAPVR